MKKIFTPEKYKIEDISQVPFIDANEIRQILRETQEPNEHQVNDIINKSLNKKRLSLYETAILLNASSTQNIEKIKEAAKELKRNVYGNRIVIFAPLYVGNKCVNNCKYCGFSVKNKEAIRKTLTNDELAKETEVLLADGHKRTILVYGEHPDYDAQFIADNVRKVYSIKKGNGEIRRININAAPFDIEGFKIIKESGIGTFQVFQESYDSEVYDNYHESGLKKDFNYRLTSMDRAMEAGIDDVGLGALFGLGDWKFEVLGLIRHTNHLESCYGVGPHTISFPRIKDAPNVRNLPIKELSDDNFLRMIAILRLAVPYTGLILTAREPAHLRKEILSYGVSQIDGGTNIEIGGYSKENKATGQFKINDDRTLAEVIDELIEGDYIPSFCTACYRKGRTGEHFMEFSVPGFIKRYCTPNAILTLAEYLEDYASVQTKEKGYQLIEKNIETLAESKRDVIERKVARIKMGERDLLE